MKNSDDSHDGSLSDPVVLARLDPVAFAYLMDPRYEPGNVHYAMGRKLRELEEGTITRLAVMAPPRHGKSELCSINFIAWFLGLHPDSNVIFASYNQDIASKVATRVRDIVSSPQFRVVFPGVVLSPTAATDRWTIPGHRGGFLAAGVGGTMTGFGADLFVIDDPIKNMEAASSAHQREDLSEWMNTTALSRLQPGGRMLMVMQRWHLDDIVGRLKQQQTVGGEPRWTTLEFPALSPDGEPLWPEQFSREELEDRRASMDISHWSALWMQDPMSAKGKVFDREWFPRVTQFRPCIARWISVDTAYKDGDQNDYSVAIVAELLPDYRLQIRSVWRRRVQLPELVDELQSLIARWDHDDKLRTVIIEDAASGTGAYQLLTSAVPQMAYYLHARMPHGSKLERARLVSPWVRRGAILLPEPSDDVPWLFDLEQELFEFPGVIHDDQVDAFVHLVDYLSPHLQEGFEAREAYREQQEQMLVWP